MLFQKTLPDFFMPLFVMLTLQLLNHSSFLNSLRDVVYGTVVSTHHLGTEC